VLARYERQIERLQASLSAGIEAGDDDGSGALRDLIEFVKVERDPARAAASSSPSLGGSTSSSETRPFPMG
jgi:hypothetical protein